MTRELPWAPQLTMLWRSRLDQTGSRSTAHTSTPVSSSGSVNAPLGTEIDDEFAGAQVERTNEPFDDVLINEEVLTEFATPRVALGW